LEKVIKDTECLFQSREKEYQETIDQIEVRSFDSLLQFHALSNYNTAFELDNVQSANQGPCQGLFCDNTVLYLSISHESFVLYALLIVSFCYFLVMYVG